jgi:hypothetical protein
MALDLDFFKDIGRSAKAIGTGVVDFFRNTPPTGLADPNVNLGQFKVRGTSRSRAGVSSFGDIGEASFYKYAQLQNTVRYLYNQKARYKSIAKAKV